MAHRPFSGECSVLAGREHARNGTQKVFLRELAPHLGVSLQELSRMARKRRLLKRSHLWPSNDVPWVTPFGAAQLITWVRMTQGATILEGKDWFAEAQKRRAARARHMAAAKARAQAAKEQTEQMKRIAFSVAGAEAESAERSGGEDDSGIDGNPGGVHG